MRSLVVAGVVLAAFIAGILPSPLPVTGARAAATADPETLSGTVAVTAAPTSNGVFPTDGVLTVVTTIDNGSGADLTDARVSAGIGDAPLTERPAVRAWLAGDTAPPAGAALGEAETTDADSGAAASVRFTNSDVLAERAPGVYPVWTLVDTGDSTITATTVVTVTGAGTEPTTPTGVVVPIIAPPLSTGLLSADALADLTAEDGALTAQLDAVDGTQAILAVDPAIAAAIRVLGTSAPASATAWLGRLERLPNSRFALQFGDADVTTQIAGGLAAPLAPTSLLAYMDAADFVDAPEQPDAPTQPPSPTVSPTSASETGETESPAESDDPDATEDLPSLEQLLDIGPERSAVYWPPTGTAGSATVAALDATSDEAVVLLGSESTAAASESIPALQQTDAGTALVYDSDVSAALGAAGAEGDASVRGAPLAAASAYLFLATADVTDGDLLVVVDRTEIHSSGGIRSAVEAVASAPGAIPATLGTLLSSTAGATTIVGGASDEERTAAVDGLLRGETAVSDFATIIDDPALLTGPQRASILQVLGSGWLTQPQGWSDALAAHADRTQATLDAVGIQPSSDVTLIAAGADLRFWIRNDLPYPATVVFHVQPNDLRLHVEQTTTVVAEASSNTRIEIPVEARIASGDVDLDLRLTSVSGMPLGPELSVQVTVRAEWEGIGLGILGVLIGLLLGAGVFRTVLRRRARSRAADADPADANPADANPADDSAAHDTATDDNATEGNATEDDEAAAPERRVDGGDGASR